MISVFDRERGVVRDRAGYARPPHCWEPAADEYDVADYPRTEAVLRTGEPYTCVLDSGDADPGEVRWLRELGFASLMMLSLVVEGEPYALVEIYDERRRAFRREELRLATALASEAGTMVARARMNERLEDAYFATLGTLAAALEAKDAYTNDHASKIAELAGRVVRAAGLDAAATRVTRLGALLHDIGKIGIPEAILHKPGSLTGEEMLVMQRAPRHRRPHPRARPLLRRPGAARALQPRALGRPRLSRRPGGEEIPLGSRVIAVCDAFHAMTEDRIYRRAMPLAAAIAEVERCAGSQFDPICVDALIAVLRGPASGGGVRDSMVRIARYPSS